MDRRRVIELHYITPIDNLNSIMKHGILSHRCAAKIGHTSIADETIQDLRRSKRVPGGRLLHDYANVYFDARNPMMYKRLAQKSRVAVVRVSPNILDLPGVVLTDGNAASSGTSFHPSPAGLTVLDESRVYAHAWTDPDTWTYWEKKRQRCAEVLVPDFIPPDCLTGCYVCAESVMTLCKQAAPAFDSVVDERVFFD